MKKTLVGLSALALGLTGAAYAADPMPGGDPVGDKTMTKAEFQAKGAAMFDKMDANHDGKLDAADRAAHESQMFDHADANHDGALSRDELMAAHQHGSGGDAGAESLRHGGAGDKHGGEHGGGMMMLKMADTNKDGVVSRDEFLAAHAQHFAMIDANHDGQITPAERKAARDKLSGLHHGGKHADHTMGAGPMGDMPPPPPAAN